VYIGLSGGIGSGKSTVAKIFAELGAVVIDADAIAKEVLEPGQIGFENVLLHFGTEVLDSSGNIDRKELAKLVFNNESQLAYLEGIVHPAVIARVTEIRESLPHEAVVIYDTPLLFEKKLQDQFDKVIIVVSDLELRTARLVDRGLSIQDIDSRIANQATDDEKVAVADIVLVNNGSIQDLRDQVLKAWNEISA
jgi:dephospho-CoA kinase